MPVKIVAGNKCDLQESRRVIADEVMPAVRSFAAVRV